MSLKHLGLAVALIVVVPAATADPLDTLQAPTWNPATHDADTNTLTLSWQPSNDASYVYHLYRNGILLATTTDTTYTDTISFSYMAYHVTATRDGTQSVPSLPLVIQQRSSSGSGPTQQMVLISGGPNMDVGPCEILGTPIDPSTPPFVTIVIHEECIPVVGRSLSLPGPDVVGWWE